MIKKIVIRNVSICTKPNLKVPLLQLSAYWGTSGYGYKIYGWNSNTTFSNEQMRNMPVSNDGDFYKGTYLNNANYQYNQNYAYPNGLPSMGCPSNINMYNSIFF